MTKSFVSLGKKFKNMKTFFKNKKDKSSYKTAFSVILKALNKMCKLKPHNESLKIAKDQIELAIKNKDEEAYSKWLKIFRNNFMFDTGTIEEE